MAEPLTRKEAEAAERLDAARTAARLGCSVGSLTKRQREMLVAKVCFAVVDTVLFLWFLVVTVAKQISSLLQT